MFQETTARLNGAVVVTVIGSIFGGLGVLLAPLVYNNFGWAALAVVWGVVAASLYLISLQGIRENPKYAEAEDAPILERLGVVLRNRTFLIVVGLNLCFRMILAVLTASLPFYTKYALNDERAITVLVGVFLAAYTVGMIAWQPVFKRFGTRNTLLISMLVFAAASLLTLITSTVTGTMLVVALIGFGLQGPMLVGAQLLFGDTVDEDYAKTGIRREGLYRGMLGFVYRWPPAFSALLLSEFLARSGYDATVPPAMQPPLVGNSIRYFIAFAPMISALIGAALAYIYPLHGERFKQIQADVQRRNAELEEVSTHQNP
jgi:GPH family glycoside/pentoside/hexuronide:cation symporter